MKGDFGDLFQESWETFTSKFALLGLIGVIFSLIPNSVFSLWENSRTSYLPQNATPTLTQMIAEAKAISPWIFALFLFSTFFTVAIIYALNIKDNKKKVGLGFVMDGAWKFYFSALLLSVLLYVFLIPLYLMLIIPGIIFSIYWVFAMYVLVNEDRGVMDSLKGSYNTVKDNWWITFGYVLLINIVLFFVTIIPSVIFQFLGDLGIVLDNAFATLASIFMIIFFNAFYLSLKESRSTFREKNSQRVAEEKKIVKKVVKKKAVKKKAVKKK